jgi:hypothetical protein
MRKLTRRRMLESTVGDGSEKFRLQEEVTEACRMDADIAAFLICIAARNGEITLLGCPVCGSRISNAGGIVGLQLLVRVVDQIFFMSHGVCCGEGEIKEKS